MSAEAYVLATLVEEGSPKKAFQAGISVDDFDVHKEEFEWVVYRAENNKPINVRLFRKAFPDFDFINPENEKLTDLLDELKNERAFTAIESALDEILVDITPDNALERAIQLREVLGDVLRAHSANSDVFIKGGWQEHYKHMRELSILAETGQIPGIPSGVPHFDHHFGGWQGEASYLFLGRPGDAKSFTLAQAVVEAAWSGYRVGLFSPEMTSHQHWCRIHTLLSAKKEIQDACGLKGAFRNRALKDGRGFNLKSYKRFCSYLESHMPGEIIVFTQKYRRERMTPGYIESRVEDLGLDMVVVDPIYKLKSPRRRQLKHEELGEIVDSLTNIGRSFNIPVLLSNQAHRQQGRQGDAPTKDSSFGADAPVHEADCVIGVKHFSEERVMKLNCSKNRHGEQFKFTMKFHPNIGVMEDVTQIRGDYFNGYDPEKVGELQQAMKEMEDTE